MICSCQLAMHSFRHQAISLALRAVQAKQSLVRRKDDLVRVKRGISIRLYSNAEKKELTALHETVWCMWYGGGWRSGYA